jgi:hypothetical protein
MIGSSQGCNSLWWWRMELLPELVPDVRCCMRDVHMLDKHNVGS